MKNNPYHFDLYIEEEAMICRFFRCGVVWGHLCLEQQLEMSVHEVQSSSQRSGRRIKQVLKTSGSRKLGLLALGSVLGCSFYGGGVLKSCQGFVAAIFLDLNFYHPTAPANRPFTCQ